MVERVAHDVRFLLLAVLVGLCLEIFWRREPMTIRQMVNGFQFWPFLIGGKALCAIAMLDLFQSWGVRPLRVTASLPVAAQLLVFVLAMDLLFYVAHRLQHRFFWRFHSLHHSIEKLSALNSYHHWSEPVFQWVLIITPALLLGLRPTASTFLVLTLVKMQPYLIHSPTRLHLGPLGKVIIDGRFHRIHHSLEPKHFDRNFGALTPLWDWLFGTAYWPARGEWPAVGVAGRQEPRSLGAWFGWKLRNMTPVEGNSPAGDGARRGNKLDRRNVVR